MHVLILGSRGIPSCHGGFETFAQDFALFLRSRNHDVTVYCQVEAHEPAGEDLWNGIRRVLIPAGGGSAATMLFDWKAIRHSLREEGVVLTLGYNTGLFNLAYRFSHLSNLMNMDGIDWQREKWSFPARAWLWFNEWAGARVANHLVADHPEIGRYLSRHTSRDKITVIPYGADLVTSAPVSLIQQYKLKRKNYHLLIARPEPENYILEVVKGYSIRKRGMPLVILGNYSADGGRYQKAVLDAAGPEVVFLGAVFERDIVRALRFYARGYFHGHRVGGTNPSLVESLAAGNAIIAHDNRFNHWVAGEGARYFRTPEDIDEILVSLERQPAQLIAMEAASRKRHAEAFTQEQILSAYEKLLLRYAPQPVTEAKPAIAAQPLINREPVSNAFRHARSSDEQPVR
jgi:glycosyltransferase involved in cell wall biosynthesis